MYPVPFAQAIGFDHGRPSYTPFPDGSGRRGALRAETIVPARTGRRSCRGPPGAGEARRRCAAGAARSVPQDRRHRRGGEPGTPRPPRRGVRSHIGRAHRRERQAVEAARAHPPRGRGGHGLPPGGGVGGSGSLRPSEPEPPAPPAEADLPPSGETPRILVVDDDPVSSRLVEGVLKAAGISSMLCGDPAKAFDLAVQENPDLIILDVAMPGMDGFRLCQRLRAHSGLQLTPVIFVTRKGNVEQRVRGLQVGGNDYLAKPFDAEELVARVRSHLQRLSGLRELALRDGLTGCYNNQYFKRRREQELSRADRHQGTVAVAMIDIDHFKRINDGYGHPAGDAVLAQLASILIAAVRSHDVVARYGGEEFGIILVEAGPGEAELVSNRLRERVQLRRFEVPASHGEQPRTASCTLSLGIASFRKGDTAASLLQRADTALYEGKRARRNRVWVAS